MKIWLFTNVRDEQNIEEWCAFHTLLGFDHIVVLDHLSVDPVAEKLAKWTASGAVEVQRIDWKLPIKNRCIKHAVNMAKQNDVDWMLYLDGDEYLSLHPRYESSVERYIVETEAKTGKRLNMIAMNCLLFGSNGHSTRPDGLVIDNYTKCARQLDIHVKCLVRPDTVVRVTLPHFYYVSGDRDQVVNYAGRPVLPVGTDEQMAALTKPFQRFARRADFVSQGYGCFNFDNADSLEEAYALIAHYDGQSYDTYMKRKVNRFRDDVMLKREHFQEAAYHLKNNDVTFERLKNDYSLSVATTLRNLNAR